MRMKMMLTTMAVLFAAGLAAVPALACPAADAAKAAATAEGKSCCADDSTCGHTAETAALVEKAKSGCAASSAALVAKAKASGCEGMAGLAAKAESGDAEAKSALQAKFETPAAVAGCGGAKAASDSALATNAAHGCKASMGELIVRAKASGCPVTSALAAKAESGDEQARSELIAKYEPAIAKAK